METLPTYCLMALYILVVHCPSPYQWNKNVLVDTKLEYGILPSSRYGVLDLVSFVVFETFDRVDGSLTFNLRHKIKTLWPQNGSPVAEYINKLKALVETTLMPASIFLGLDNSYMQLRSNILSRDPLHDAKGAYVLISSEESHRAVVTGSEGVVNIGLKLLGNTSRNLILSILLINNGNVRTDGGSYFRRFINNNKYVGSSSTTFSNEQISKLISLRKENSLNDKGKGVQANMEVGNLIPTDFLTLYDVLVVPEYSVALVSVHKVARDIKFIVGFDESKCFLMSQDLMDVKIMGIGKQVNGLYYFDSVEGNLFKNGVPSSNNTKLNLHKRLGHPSDQNPPHKFKWNEKTVPVAEGSSETTTEGYMENYKNVSQDIRNQLDAEAEAVQIILKG
ncbi:hypothetical protein Tco_1368364 [Tanacetum coccineum]